MYSIFFDRSPLQYTRRAFPEVEYLKRTYQTELKKIHQYYRERTFTLKSNHLLVRLLMHSPVSLMYPIDQAMEVCHARAPYIANAFHLTSELHAGQFFDGVFYGENHPELLLHHSRYLNPFQFEQQWKTCAPVTVLWHPNSNLSLLPPLGKQFGTESGLTVLSIDIAALTMQYRQFLLEQMALGERDDTVMAAPYFLMRYVIPNMLAQQTDLVIVNRLMNLFTGAPMGVTTSHYPFLVHQYGQAIDTILTKLLDAMSHRGMKYEAMLRWIPSLTGLDGQSTLQLPEFALTRQVYWALLLSRLTVVRFLIDVGGENAKRQNQTELNRLRRTLQLLGNEHVLNTVVPANLLYDIQVTIDYLKGV